jgi:hypothetical protein
MNLPRFIITGFPKCGSTSLHYYLDAHPDIFMPKKKELHFFTQQFISKLNQGPGDINAKQTQIKHFNDYISLFKNSSDEKIVGETSPSYINYPESFEMISSQLKDPKIIILLRDPIKRAYSNFLHLKREQRELETFESALELEESRKEKNYSDFWYYTFNSMYYDKIIKAKANFSQVLILTQEEFNLETKKTLKKVYSFLDVDQNFVPSNYNNRYNKGGLYKKNLITNFIFGQGYAKGLIKKWISVRPWMKNIKNRFVSKFHYSAPILDRKVEQKLINLFKQDVLKITKLGVNTSLWNNGYFTK